MMTLDSFKSARSVLSGVINETNLIYSPAFSASCGNNVYLKPENMQVTGAYKIRGAYFKISTLSEEEKALGLITASAGNHAQGVAYAARHAGVSATVVMPTTTPMLKVNNTKGYGAKVILHGSTFDDAAAKAMELAESEECGLFPKGEAHLAVRRGETEIGGRTPINTSGGLKAKGHPLGATGVSQVVELVRQLRGEADGRQVEGAKTGLAVTFGGFGNNVVATIVTTD